MKFGKLFLSCAMFSLLVPVPAVLAQSQETGKQTLALSAFGGMNATETGLSGGRNLGITAGVDLSYRHFHWFLPSLELRGTLPVDGGQIASVKNGLGGLKFEKPYGRYHPYVDALFGRAEIDYENGGDPNPQYTFLYKQSPSNVYDIGGGVDIDLTYHLAFKGDAQFQHLSVPVTTSGTIYPMVYTAGVVYRFRISKVYVPH